MSAVSNILESSTSEDTKDRMIRTVARGNSLHVTPEELQRSTGVDDLRMISPQVAVRSRGNEYLVLDPDVVQSVHQERVDTAAAMQHVAAQQSAVEHDKFLEDLSSMALT